MRLPAIMGATLGAAILSLTLVTSPAIAGNPCGYDSKNPCADAEKNPCAYKERRAKHHAMKKEHMGMMREIMVILRDLNKRPTAEQKKRLDHYIEKLDDSLSKCELHEKKRTGDKPHHKKQRKD